MNSFWSAVQKFSINAVNAVVVRPISFEHVVNTIFRRKPFWHRKLLTIWNELGFPLHTRGAVSRVHVRVVANRSFRFLNHWFDNLGQLLLFGLTFSLTCSQWGTGIVKSILRSSSIALWSGLKWFFSSHHLTGRQRKIVDFSWGSLIRQLKVYVAFLLLRLDWPTWEQPHRELRTLKCCSGLWHFVRVLYQLLTEAVV